MKFDPARAVALAETFAGPRFAGPAGEAEALDRVADELGAAGWVVSRPEVGTVPGPRSPSWARAFSILAAVQVVAIDRSARHGHWEKVVAGLIFLPLNLWLGFRVGRAPSRSIPSVEAEGPVGDVDLPRVVIAARLAKPTGRLGGPARAVAAGLVILMAVVIQATARGGADRPIGVTIGAWAGVIAGLATLAYEPRPNTTGPGANRTGLALLVELARTWPRSARGRLDVRFRALAGPEACPTPIASAPPTLTILLTNPALGTTLRLGGTPAVRDLALQAARDLWVPHEPAPGRSPPRGTGDPAAPSVTLAGRPGDEAPIDPATLGRAAQLVVEVALRWSKEGRAG